VAGKRKRANGWEYVFKRAGVLDKPIYMTFADEAEGDRFAARLDALLARGIVPTEFQAQDKPLVLRQLIGLYERDAHPSDKDKSALGTILESRGGDALTALNVAWVDEWITEMKRLDKLAPATIRAKVGALARCTDWGIRKGYLVMPDHPLHTLPEGYAQYTKTDETMAGVKRQDVERDRRLELEEFDRIMAVIDGGVLARSQRPLRLDPVAAHRLLFVLAVESAMRLREMYTLTLDQIDLSRRTVFLDKTKNGDKRQVPLSSVAHTALRDYLADNPGGFDGRLFPWWSGDGGAKALAAMSDFLSKRFADIFEQAGAHGLRFHDLRHEATCRLFERTQLTETAIMKITGHKSHRMLMRYANLRGSTLADALW
jgi:integrase